MQTGFNVHSFVGISPGITSTVFVRELLLEKNKPRVFLWRRRSVLSGSSTAEESCPL